MTSRIGPDTAERIRQAWPDLLERIAAGDRVDKSLEALKITRNMVRAYLRDVAGARAEWDDAREASADAYFDELQDVTYNPGSDPAAARVKQQGLMWMAAKRDPRRYSDRVDHNVTVKTIDLTRIIEAANARLASARVIDGQVVVPALIDLI